MKFKVQSSRFKVLAILSILIILPKVFAAGISTNKTFVVETNNVLPPNETDFFEVNLGLLEEAIAPGGGVAGSEDWIVSQLNPPGIYVDSVMGNDTNTGTEASPLQHLYAVTAALGANSTIATNIYLKRDSKFYESFVVPTNSVLRDYSIGVKPIITGVMNLANALFTLTAGKTNTYSMPLAAPIETNVYAFNLVQSNVMMVWQSNVRMGARWDQNASYNNNTNTAINSVDGNPNSFFYDLTNHVLYINPSTNGNPATNGLIYEASIRTLALVGSSNCTVSNIIAEKSYAHDNIGNEGYAILGQQSGVFANCVGRHSWNHNIGLAPSLANVGSNSFINCYGWDVEPGIAYTDAGTSFVADAGSATNVAQILFSNCLAIPTPLGLPQTNSSGNQTWGFYAHDIAAVQVQIINCVATQAYWGFSAQTNTSCSGCVATGCYAGIQGFDPNSSVSNFTAYGCQFGAIGEINCTNLSVFNSKFYQNTYDISGGTKATNLFITNNVFASSNNFDIGISAQTVYTPIFSYNNSFYNILYCYNYGMMTNRSGANAADYNNYYDNTRIAIDQAPSPGYYVTFANWQTAWSLVDPHGTTSNPGYSTSQFAYSVADPSGGDMSATVNLPSWIAIENGGGLTNIQGSNLTGNVFAPGNLYVQKTNFADYELVTNFVKALGGGLMYGNSSDALDLYGDSGGDDISIFHANGGNSIVFDASANLTLYGGTLSGTGSGLTALNASSVSSGTLGSNYLQTVFSNYAVHVAGIPTVTYTANSTQPIYTGGTMTYRSGNDFSAHYTITNGAGTGSASSGLTVFNFTPQFPFSTNVAATVNQTCYNQYGETIAGYNFVRQWWCSNNVSSAGLVTNFSILENNYGNTLASGIVYGVVITVSGQ
jgi:hypothetical protein